MLHEDLGRVLLVWPAGTPALAEHDHRGRVGDEVAVVQRDDRHRLGAHQTIVSWVGMPLRMVTCMSVVVPLLAAGSFTQIPSTV